jgi:hypothetical protein
VPGVEGVGVVEALAADVAPSHRIQVGTRAAFFPINGSWSSRIAAPLQSLIPVSNEVSDEVAAQMVVNTLTARLAMRAGHNALPEDKREDVTVIQTAANFAVGKRLCVLQIDEPPLRARGKDIEVLAMYMLERFRKDANRRLHGFTPDAIAALHSYRWPGNVRELINRVRRAIVMAGGRRITALD